MRPRCDAGAARRSGETVAGVAIPTAFVIEETDEEGSPAAPADLCRRIPAPLPGRLRRRRPATISGALSGLASGQSVVLQNGSVTLACS
jgi:hypothetical protein